MWHWIERRVFVMLTTPAMLVGAAVHLTKRGYQVGVLLVEVWIERI